MKKLFPFFHQCFGKQIALVASILIIYACQTSTKKEETIEIPKNINYTEHIAPIIYKNCLPCHNKEGAAPFSLENIKEVLKHAKMIRKVTTSRYMPPWPADASYSEFLNQKVLTKKEIAFINAWVNSAKELGDTTKLPQKPLFTNHSRIGKPDLVIKLKDIYKIKGDNTDDFLIVKYPYELPSDTFVRYIEFVPGNTKLVHHVNTNLVSYDDHKKKTTYKGASYINTNDYDDKTAYEKLDIPNDDGTYPLLTLSVANYLPGMEPYLFPENIGGYTFKKKGVLMVNEFHYGPTPIDATDNSYFNIFFMPHAPKRPTHEITLGTNGVSAVVPPLVIPPNEIKTFKTQATVQTDISLMNLNPHMHLLGKSFLAYAITPTNDTIKLIRINHWDFRWQYVYTFKKMLKIPAGSTIYVEGTFDNTTHNPLNPFYPPQTVSEKNGSMRTTDEMFQLILMYLPYQTGDENVSLEPYKN